MIPKIKLNGITSKFYIENNKTFTIRLLQYRYRRGGSSLTGLRTQDPLLSPPPIDMSGNILAPVSV